MSDEKPEDNGRINILGDITIKASNISNMVFTEENYHNSIIPQDTDKENIPDIDYTIADLENNSGRPQSAASMFSFDEEPVFSDSDEEREYTKKVLEAHNLSFLSNEQTKKVSVGVQCDLTSCDMQLLELAKKCASFNTEGVNEEFKELIQLCRHLNYKYQCDTPPSSIDERNFSENQVTEPQSQNQQICSSSPKTSDLPEFLPSRQGSDDFSSERLTFKNSQLDISGIIKCLSRESSVDANNCKLKETGGNRLTLNVRRSSRLRTRLRKPPEIKKIAKSGMVTRTRLQKASKGCKNLQNDTDRDLKNKPSREFKITRKRARQKSIEDIVLDFLLARKSKRKNVGPCSSSENKDNMSDDVHFKIRLPKNQVRSLARNWMKPHKNVVISNLSDTVNHENTSLKRRIKQLYSPTAWLRSKDFANLCEK